MSKLRTAVITAVDEDIEAIITQLVSKAPDDDRTAEREILDRTQSKAAQSDLLHRIEALETVADRLSRQGHP